MPSRHRGWTRAAAGPGPGGWIEVLPPPRLHPAAQGGRRFRSSMNSTAKPGHTLRTGQGAVETTKARAQGGPPTSRRVGHMHEPMLKGHCIFPRPTGWGSLQGHPWFGKTKETTRLNRPRRRAARKAGFERHKRPAKDVHLISTPARARCCRWP